VLIPAILFDMFRIANGKIVERWDMATKP